MTRRRFDTSTRAGLERALRQGARKGRKVDVSIPAPSLIRIHIHDVHRSCLITMAETELDDFIADLAELPTMAELPDARVTTPTARDLLRSSRRSARTEGMQTREVVRRGLEYGVNVDGQDSGHRFPSERAAFRAALGLPPRSVPRGPLPVASSAPAVAAPA
jgi:hypothetical protein